MSKCLILQEDVFFSVTEGQGVFLDLKRDAYSAVPLAANMSASAQMASPAELSAALRPFLSELVEAELVRESSEAGGSLASFQSLERPRTHAFDPDDCRAFGCTATAARDAPVGLRDVWNFARACRSASRSLRASHIRDVVRSVRSRKASAGGISPDLVALRRHTAIFSKLRPWYAREYLCLFDALALLEFLAYRRLFPDWVFAVHAQPFGAHCWIQSGDWVLNEATEYTQEFTPIMVV